MISAGEAGLAMQVQTLQRRFERERRARLQAEAIAEKGLRDLHQRERHAVLLESLAGAANGTSASDEVLKIALQEICRHTGWVCGFVHMPESEGALELTCTPHWFVDGEGLELFLDETLRSKFAPSEGLPGRVAFEQKIHWLRDVTTDAGFKRRTAAAACGIRTGVAVPVMIGGRTAAVVEFFGRDALEADPVFTAVLGTIAVQLARVVERQRTQARLYREARHDALTDLPNRAQLVEHLTARLGDPSCVFSTLFIDLDRFKLINDSLGHRAGDILLIEVADRFHEVLRQQASPFLLARLGGDEFVAIVEAHGVLANGVQAAEQLLAALGRPVLIEGQLFYGSASIGVTHSSFGYTTADDNLRDADLAMYEAKRSGKGRVGAFEPRLHLTAMSRLAMEADLRRALRERQFLLHYQPIVPLGADQPLGFEALIRWEKAPGVLVPPSAFIDIAEETGLIVFIGAFVLEEACRTVASWNHWRAVPDWLSVSVNVSPRQLQQADFVSTVERALADAGASPTMLRIELTESAAVANFDQTAKTLVALRDIGVRVSIDDFGTGHSSLSYLHRLTFDTIKIDRSFVQAMTAADDTSSIIKAVLDLARQLDVRVVAEGAETPEQMQMLRQMGCGYVQGFYVSRPLDRCGAERWLTSFSAGSVAA